ncbi:hypothetical protein COR52_27470 [Vibrio mediterranei]|uniref:Uncharacterized protein n=1 Tax=Vibrio mediterranei TaxID=689 RepID=A0ABX5D769_9VIBR|nr:hypothetical protein COR52_27470 [Vibrio mediterranei]PRQ64496.1 hypothetical protein COR51_27175 [Vibrio mediterranei]
MTGLSSALISAFKTQEDSGGILAPMLLDSTEQTITHQELPPAYNLSLFTGCSSRIACQYMVLITIAIEIVPKVYSLSIPSLPMNDLSCDA